MFIEISLEIPIGTFPINSYIKRQVLKPIAIERQQYQLVVMSVLM